MCFFLSTFSFSKAGFKYDRQRMAEHGTKINFIIMGLLTILFFVPSFAQDNDGDIRGSYCKREFSLFRRS